LVALVRTGKAVPVATDNHGRPLGVVPDTAGGGKKGAAGAFAETAMTKSRSGT